MRKLAYFVVSVVALGAGIGASCDDTVPLRAAPDDGGTGSETATATEAGGIDPPGMVQQKGRIVDFGQQGTGVASATITLGPTVTLTSDAKGNYTTFIPLNTPVVMNVTAPNYYRLIEGEWLLKADADRGTTRLLSNDSATTLLSALSLAGPLDKTLGIISLWAIPKTGCPSEEGVVFDVQPQTAKTHRVYLKGGIPDTTLNAGVAGENPHVAFYNLPVGPITVTATHPTCGQLPYPQDDAMGFTYTGNVTVSGDGTTVSFFRVFLGSPIPVTDAGTDSGGSTDAGSDADADQ
jgi:hypothetical protein